MPEHAIAIAASATGRRQTPVRNYVVVGALMVIGIWLVIVFSHTLGDLAAANFREAAVRAETATLQERLDQGQRELTLVQTDAFLRLQARGYGMGLPGEKIFALEPGAPSPAPITPLGGPAAPAPAQTALEAWLELLFGR